MMVLHLIRDLKTRIPHWDASSRLSLFSSLILLPILLIIGFLGPEPVQIPARVGAFGVLLTLQLVILWGNRKVLSPFHEAQQLFIKGEYESAREILEQLPSGDQPSTDALVLLGNTYRHLGQFDKSLLAIQHALELQSDYHFALYSLGKLYLVTGTYEDASNFITKALSLGAPDVVQFDLGQAYYYSGDYRRAEHHFQNILTEIDDEPSQLLLVQYYLYQMQKHHKPLNHLSEVNIAYWQNEANKYHETPYGLALKQDVDILSTWL